MAGGAYCSAKIEKAWSMDYIRRVGDANWDRNPISVQWRGSPERLQACFKWPLLIIPCQDVCVTPVILLGEVSSLSQDPCHIWICRKLLACEACPSMTCTPSSPAFCLWLLVTETLLGHRIWGWPETEYILCVLYCVHISKIIWLYFE